MDDAAIGRIIHAVEHWADDIPEPERTLHVGFSETLDDFLNRLKAVEGEYPGGHAKIWVKLDDGRRFAITSDW